MSQRGLLATSAPRDNVGRTQYPAEVFTELGTRCGLDGSQRALDLGCGRGQATVPLASRVAQVAALDPDPEMLAEGRRRAEQEGVTNIRWHQGTAADLAGLRLAPLDLALMAESFQWMDRDATLRTLDGLVVPGGVVVLITGSMSSTAPDSPARPSWVEAVIQTRRRWIPWRRRWLGDTVGETRTYSVVRREHQQALWRSAFPRVEHFQVSWERRHDLESLIALQLAVPDATPRALGARQDGFTADLRCALLAVQPDGVFAEPIRTEVMIGRRAN